MDGKMICKRFAALQTLRKPLDATLQDIQRLVVPYRGEFFSELRHEGEQQWKRRELFDATAPTAVNLLASQMQGTMTSASTRWFDFRFRDPALNKDIEAKRWLETCVERTWQALLDSDFFTEVAEIYLDLASFGTSVMMMEEESLTGLTWEGLDFTALPMMDTYFEIDPKGAPTFVVRRLRYTTEHLLDRFPSLEEKDLKDIQDKAQDVEARHEVLFAVYYRDDVEPPEGARQLAPAMRPVGYKYVLKDGQKELEEGGYYHFPAHVVRWSKTAGSRWGYSPAMVCLSDVKQLNETVAQVIEARAKAIDPPYLTTSRGVIGDLDLASGGLTMATEIDQVVPMVSAARFDQADAEIARLQASIQRTFYLDWLDLKESPQMTATEVHARRENQRRLMGPVVGRVSSDLLEPTIINTMEILGRNGKLPEIPEALMAAMQDPNSDAELDIEYTGELARAQKADVAIGIETWLATLSAASEIKPDNLDLANWDECLRQLGLLRGVPASAIADQDEVDEKRQIRAQQEALRQQIEMQSMAGEAAQNIGQGAEALGMVQRNEA